MDDHQLAGAVYGLPDHERAVVQEMHSRVEQIVALPLVIFDDSQPILIRQSCLDAFYIHVRAITEFFAPRAKRPRPSDRHAGHYATRDRWEPPTQELILLQDVARDVDKQIAHVTVERVGDGPGTPPEVLLLELDEAHRIANAVRAVWDDLVRHTDSPWPRVGLFPVWTDPHGNLRRASDYDKLRTELE